MISNAMLFLLKTQCTILYNILLEFIFGKTDTQNVFKHISDLKKIKYTGEVDKIDSSVSIYLFNHFTKSVSIGLF